MSYISDIILNITREHIFINFVVSRNKDKTMNRKIYLPIIALAVTFSACSNGKKSEIDLTNNPFMEESTLPYHAPDFTKIKVSDFQPAMEEGMKEQLEAIKKITDNSEAPTFENTFIPLEKSSILLNRVYNVFGLLAGANTNSEIQKIEEIEAPKMAAQRNKIFLDDKLFQRVKTVYNQLDTLDLDAESKRLVTFYYEKFELAGANLSEEAKAKLKKLNEEEALLQVQFANRLLAAGKNSAYKVTDLSKLEGMSESEIKSLAQETSDDSRAKTYVVPMQNTTQQPVFPLLKNRETRHEIFENSISRAENGDSTDTREIIKRIANIRAEQASLLGFKNFAEWNLQDQMAKTPEAALELLKKLTPASIARAKSEAGDIQKMIDKENGNFKLEPWDWDYYSEKVRKEKYDLEESQIKPYFELNSVLQNGIFFAAEKLYGLTFKERHDIPVYQEDVRVFEIFNEDGSELGLFYCDYFKRDNKSGGAWMGNIIEQSKLLGDKPVIYNVCNFTKPNEGQPALLSYDEVTTMFHEFGHGLHGLFADEEYPSLSGTNVPRDFVEVPSQFNEHWALYPEVLNNYAKHYKTGEVIPQNLVDKINNAATFNQGYMMTELLAAAGLDMEWHSLSVDNPVKNVDEFEENALKNIGLDMAQIPPRYRSTYFLHIWGHGYAAGYYAYLWSEVLEDDIFTWFEQNGGLTRENGQRMRDMILSRGNSEDQNKLFDDFMGREVDITPMLKDRGLL